MSKRALLDNLLAKHKGVLKTSDAVGAGVSRSYFLEYVRATGLEKIAHGIYAAQDAWRDEMFLLQTRFPQTIFSHETALFLLGLASREPMQYTVTAKSGYHTDNMAAQDVKIYFVKASLFDIGVTNILSPYGHEVRAYNAERTICDLIRSRSNVEIQDLQTAMREYVKYKEKNMPLLMRYAQVFRVEKILRQYLEVLVP